MQDKRASSYLFGDHVVYFFLWSPLPVVMFQCTDHVLRRLLSIFDSWQEVSHRVAPDCLRGASAFDHGPPAWVSWRSRVLCALLKDFSLCCYVLWHPHMFCFLFGGGQSCPRLWVLSVKSDLSVDPCPSFISRQVAGKTTPPYKKHPASISQQIWNWSKLLIRIGYGSIFWVQRWQTVKHLAELSMLASCCLFVYSVVPLKQAFWFDWQNVTPSGFI